MAKTSSDKQYGSESTFYNCTWSVEKGFPILVCSGDTNAEESGKPSCIKTDIFTHCGQISSLLRVLLTTEIWNTIAKNGGE